MSDSYYIKKLKNPSIKITLQCVWAYLPILPQTKNPTRYFPVIKNISNNFGYVKT